MARAHVVLADDVLDAVDEIAGERGRSRFLEQAAREKLARLALEKALDETFGVLAGSGYDHWRDRRTTAAWVRRLRRSGRRT
jgi:metal-responsive CopG/Arc/MetJ family transcriptional regulator